MYMKWLQKLLYNLFLKLYIHVIIFRINIFIEHLENNHESYRYINTSYLLNYKELKFVLDEAKWR